MILARSILAALVAAACLGCMTDFQVDPVPRDRRAAGTVYFVERHEKDERSLDVAIAAAFAKRGVTASSGAAGARPAQIDVLVSYEDRWQWDMSMYLLSMRIDLRDPETNALLASGTSMQTSLARKPAQEIIENLVGAFFEEASSEKEAPPEK